MRAGLEVECPALKNARSWSLLSRAPAAEQRRLQDRLLARYVREELYAFSPRYRAVFDDAGIDPRRIRGVDDLRRLPFTTREDLVRRGEAFVLRPAPGAIRSSWPFARKLALVLGGRRAREVLRASYAPALSLAGRRGGPAEGVACAGQDLDVLAEIGARATDLLGLGPSARVLVAFPGGPHLAWWIATLGVLRAGLRLVVPAGPPATGAVLAAAERERATALVAPPGLARRLARRAREEGRDLASLETLVLGGARTTAAEKRALAADLEACGARDVRIARSYGLTAARMAFVETPAGVDEDRGYHVWPDLCVLEVIDPRTLEPLGEGEPGELVFTTLCGHGTALLRYRTGDWAEGGVTWQPCPASGRTVPRVSSNLKPMPMPETTRRR